MNLRDVCILLLLGAAWGTTLVFMRISTPYFGAIATIWMRVVVAGVSMLIWCVRRGKGIQLKESWKKLMGMGTVNVAIPFALMAASNMVLPISTLAVIGATAPLFARLMEKILFDKPLEAKHFGALMCGVLGLAALLGWSPILWTSDGAKAVVMAIGASLLFGASGLYWKKELLEYDHAVLVCGQYLGAMIVLFPFILTSTPISWPVPFPAWLAVMALGILCTEVIYILRFSPMHLARDIKTMSSTFLAPGFGVMWGMVLFKESLSWGSCLGAGLIAISLVILLDWSVEW